MEERENTSTKITGKEEIGEQKSIKAVFIGDLKVGKTCLITSFAKNIFSENYEATVFDNQEALVSFVDPKTDKRCVVVYNLFDTAGQNGFEKQRPIAYNDSDVFFMVYSITDRKSFENINNSWLNELRRFFVKTGEKAPMILLGCKKDLRKEYEKAGKDTISKREGKRLGLELGLPFYEVSSKTQEGLKSVFDSSIEIVFRFREKHTSKEQRNFSMVKEILLNEKEVKKTQSKCCCIS